MIAYFPSSEMARHAGPQALTGGSGCSLGCGGPPSFVGCDSGGAGTWSIQSKLLSSWWMHPYMKASRCTVILDTATPLGPWEVDQQSVTDLSVLNLTTMLKRSRHVGSQPAQTGINKAGCFEGGLPPLDDVSDDVAVVGVFLTILEVADVV